jgi:hypothetical protein
MGSEIAIATGPANPGVAPTKMPKKKPEITITTVIEMAKPKIENASGP